jgi:hypothetical protein
MNRREFLAAASAGVAVGPLGAAAPAPYGAIPTQRQLRWHELETTAFLHFTVNTLTDKEWGYGDEDPNLFVPGPFDANAIVEPLAEAGMKGVILTCKHHDGFCLWPTATTDHSVSSSRWRAAGVMWCAMSRKPPAAIRSLSASTFRPGTATTRNTAARPTLTSTGSSLPSCSPVMAPSSRCGTTAPTAATVITAARERSASLTRRPTTTGRTPGSWCANCSRTQ